MILHLNLLIVDDDEDDRFFFKEAAHNIDKNIKITEAPNGLIALKRLEETANPPDLIFLDINMPVMNGFEFLPRLKQHARLKHIPVVVLSTTCEHAEKFYGMGAHSCIVKPVQHTILTAILHRVLTTDFSVSNRIEFEP